MSDDVFQTITPAAIRMGDMLLNDGGMVLVAYRDAEATGTPDTFRARCFAANTDEIDARDDESARFIRSVAERDHHGRILWTVQGNHLARVTRIVRPLDAAALLPSVATGLAYLDAQPRLVY